MMIAKTKGVPVTGASSSSDFTGIRVTVDPSATAAQRQTLIELGALEVVTEGRSVPLTRNADTAPFWGGGIITHGQQECSLGWTASAATGAVVQITARHCGLNQTWTTPAGTAVGKSGWDDLSTDSMTIKSDQADQFGVGIYTGPWDSHTAEAVVGKADPVLNESVCAGGGLSGEVCDGKVYAVNAVDGNFVGPGYKAKTDGAAGLAGVGDSGGPGYARMEDGTGVIAGGIVTSAVFPLTRPCNGGTSNPNNKNDRTCYSNVFFVYQGALEDHLGVLIMTG
jgi:hypothetical protein